MIGVKSTALKFGERTPTILWEFSTAMLCGLGCSGYMAGMAWPFFVGLGGVGVHLMYQTFATNFNDPLDCWNKFKSNHYLGALIFFSILFGSLLSTDEVVSDRMKFQSDIKEHLLNL